MMEPPEENARSRIRRSAIRLFAEKGFDGATTREIAEGAQLNIATLHYHFGSKRALYDGILTELYDDERQTLERHRGALEAAAQRDTRAFVDALNALLDDFVAPLEREPERARLYMRRWLDPSDEVREAEGAMRLRLFQTVAGLLDQAQEAGLVRIAVDHRILLRSFTWLIYGYFVSGPLDWDRLFGDPHDPRMLKLFRTFRREFVNAMLLDPAAETAA